MDGTCFVVMGFGKKTDFETGRVLDLDKSYHNLIKPAVEAAGLKCIRADEVVHSGLIDKPMYELLLTADVVVADLSTSNKNAFYELGIRHALRPYTTVVIAEDGMKPPFDVNHVLIRTYHHLGEDIGYSEVQRFQKSLTEAIRNIMTQSPEERGDSPVYRFLEGLTPPVRNKMLKEMAAGTAAGVAQLSTAENADNSRAAQALASSAAEQVHSVLMQQVDAAQSKGDFLTAKTLLSSIREMRKQAPVSTEAPAAAPEEDAYILQRLALVTYKSKHPTEDAALKEAAEVLRPLKPTTSNDPETLGLWGAIHKRRWEATKELPLLDEAIRAYERGFYIRNDYYNGINYAFLLNARAANPTDRAEAIADFVEARRVRAEVLAICNAWLADNREPQQDAAPVEIRVYRDSKYWVLATLAEAYLGLGREAESKKALSDACAVAADQWMKDSTQEQLAKLDGYLAANPLQYVKGE